jgi:hypothetical protein
MISQKKWLGPFKAASKVALMSILVFLAAKNTDDDPDKAWGVLFAFWAFLCLCKWVFKLPHTGSESGSSQNPSNQQLVSLILVLSLGICWGGYRIKSQIKSLDGTVSNIESSVEDTATKADNIESSVEDVQASVEDIQANMDDIHKR